MTFDVNELVAKIEATVVPELPEELNHAILRLHVSSRLAVVGAISNDKLKMHMLVNNIREASRMTAELLVFSHYFANISGKKFVSLPPDTQTGLESLSIHVQRSTAIVETYTDTLLKMHEMVKTRIEAQK
jgi:hypothetical protein